MAKKNTGVTNDDADEGFEIDLAPRASRKFGGDDADPVDLETGEDLFVDITPRLRNAKAEPELDEEETDEDEHESDEDEEEELDAAAADVADEDDEEEPADEVDSADEDEPARGKKKPGKWSRRLEREKRLREEAAEDKAELQTRLSKLENQIKTQADAETFTKVKAKLESTVAELTTELEQAVEDGDTKAQVRLQNQLLDAKVDLKTETIKFETAKKQVEESSNDDGSKVTIARKANQWIRKHPKFDRDVVFSSFVKAVDKQLASEGFDAKTDEYYSELDKRIKKRYPEEYKSVRDEPARKRKHPSVIQSRESDRSAAAPTKNGFRVKGNKVSLTARQVQTMRDFQLDPKNPADVREFYLNNK